MNSENEKSFQADAIAAAWQVIRAAQDENPHAFLSVTRKAVTLAERWRDCRMLTLADRTSLEKVRG